MYEIKFRDINADSGQIVTGYTLATCQNEDIANYLCGLIQENYVDVEQNPNREFFVQHNPDLTLLVI
jgi:hypothetical protein